MSANRATVGKSPNGPRLVSQPRRRELLRNSLPMPTCVCSPITCAPRATSTVPSTATAWPITSAPAPTVTLPPTATASPCTTVPGSSSIEPPTQTTSPCTTRPCGTVRSPWNTCTRSLPPWRVCDPCCCASGRPCKPRARTTTPLPLTHHPIRTPPPVPSPRATTPPLAVP